MIAELEKVRKFDCAGKYSVKETIPNRMKTILECLCKLIDIVDSRKKCPAKS